MNNSRRNLRTLALTASCLLALAACSTGPKPNPNAGLINDQVTTDRVELALKSDQGFDFSHVRVRSDKGRVFLSGTVVSEKARAEAEDKARKVNSVVKVENNLSMWENSVKLGNIRDTASHSEAAKDSEKTQPNKK